MEGDVESWSDDALVAAWRQGDEAAFEVLYRRYSRGLYSYLRQLAPHHAEDLFQETFARVLTGVQRYQARESFRAWLYTIARNLVRDSWRKKSLQVPMDDVPEPSEAAADDASLTAQVVREALQKLPEGQREVVLLREFGGLSFAEIAEATRRPLGTVLASMHRAIDRLRRHLEGK